MKICFFAKVKDRRLFDVVEFYKVDIEALRDLGHQVILVNKFWDLLTLRCDAYFVWWFGYGVFPVILAKLRGVPSILTGAVHTSNCGGLRDWPFHKRILMMIALKLANHPLFISRADFSKLDGLKLETAQVVYCAVDLQKYHPPASINKQKTILTVTHLTRDNVCRKMLLESIEAFSVFLMKNPGFIFQICGSFGDAVGDVRAKIVECGVEKHVFLLGRVTDDEKIQLLHSAFAYLQPSICEGFGLAILEAKACGTPVVTNREPCILEINEDSVVYGDNVLELADGLDRLVSSDYFYNDICRRGLDNVRKYSSQTRKDMIFKILTSL